EVDNLVLNTINTSYYALLKGPEIKTTWQRMRTIRNNVSPGNRGQELTVQAQYEQLKKPRKTMTVDNWLLRFQEVYAEALRLKLPAVSKDNAQYDFLIAIQTWESACGSTRL